MTLWLCRVFLSVLVMLPARAAGAECDPEKPANCAQALDKGEPAPFAGQLLTPSLAIDLALKADQCDARTAAEVEKQRGLGAVDLELCRELRASDQERHHQEMEAMQRETDRWKAVADIPFYREPWFVATVTVVVIGGIVVGTMRLTR